MALRVKQGFGLFEHYRRRISWAVILFGVVVILLTAPSWKETSLIDSFFDISGVLLIFAGISGRLWSIMYIGGKKNESLVTTGPYSMCRNPLYFFSFLAGFGACLEFENLILMVLYLGFFWLYYYKVINSEEKRLKSIFGEQFNSYKASTPMFVPNPFKYDSGDGPNVIPKIILKNLLDASVFLAIIPLSYVIERLQESGILVAYLKIP